MLTPDAFQSAMAERQIKLADETTGHEGEQLLPQGDHLLLDLSRGLVGLTRGSAGERHQTARSLLLEAAQPLADRGNGGV